MVTDYTPASKNSRFSLPPSHDVATFHSPYNFSEAPWTATRCLRLLRPISSKISTLGKLRRSGESCDDENIFQFLDDDIELVYKPSQVRKEVSRSDDWNFDPRPRKRVKRTYAARQRTRTGQGPLRTSKDRADNTSSQELSSVQQVIAPGALLDPLGTSGSIDDRGGSLETLFGGPHSREAFNVYEDANAKRAAGTTRNAQSKKILINNNERLKLCIGISGGLSHLLKTSTGTVIRKRRGASSLHEMCLQRMPQFIAEEEHFTLLDDPDSDRDVISEIYTHLEGLAVSDSWKPLRTIVRAHGIQHICLAIQQGTLSARMALEMVQICVQEKAYEEAVRIVREMTSKFLQNRETSGQSNSRIQTLILRAILTIRHEMDDVWPVNRIWSEILQSPSDMIACEPLLIDPTTAACSLINHCYWDDRLPEVATYLQSIMKASISNGLDDIASGISSLRETAMLRSSRLRPVRYASNQLDEHCCRAGGQGHCSTPIGCAKENGEMPIALPNLLIRMISTVASMHDGARDIEIALREDVLDILVAMSQQARQLVELKGAHACSLQQRHAIAVIILARILADLPVRCEEHKEDASFDDVSALADLGLLNTEISLCGVFIHEVAKFSEDAKGQKTFTMLGRIIDALIKLIKALPKEYAGRMLIQRITVASAFAYSEASKQSSHLEWALGIEEKIFGKDCLSPDKITLRTPARILGKSKIGYRWEEGIGEWISRTPGSSTKEIAYHPTLEDVSADELDDTTLVEEWPARIFTNCQPPKLSLMEELEAKKLTPLHLGDCEDFEVASGPHTFISVLEDKTPCSSASSQSTTNEKPTLIPFTAQDEDDLDELGADWAGKSSTQSSFSTSLQGGNKPSCGRPLRPRTCTRRQGCHESSRPLTKKGVAALVDENLISSDMEDELAL